MDAPKERQTFAELISQGLALAKKFEFAGKLPPSQTQNVDLNAAMLRMDTHQKSLKELEKPQNLDIGM